MKPGYSSTSGMGRFISVVLASLVTATVFSAVALGLTGEEAWATMVQAPAVAAPPASRPA